MLIENFGEMVYRKYREDEKFNEFLKENLDFDLELEREDETLLYSKEVENEEYIETLEGLEEICLSDSLSKEEKDNILEDLDIEENRSKLLLSEYREISRIALYFCREGVEYSEIFQEGVIGAIKAINNYSKEFGNIDNYIKIWVGREIGIFIEERFYQTKGEFEYYLTTKTEEFDLSEEEIENKINKLKTILISDIPFVLTSMEIKILEMYFGLKGIKRNSMYEVEEMLNLEKDSGEEVFYNILKKLSNHDGRMFVI